MNKEHLLVQQVTPLYPEPTHSYPLVSKLRCPLLQQSSELQIALTWKSIQPCHHFHRIHYFRWFQQVDIEGRIDMMM